MAIKNKLYSDKLRSTLASKCHLNSFLETAPFATVKEIRSMRFPIMQIMGMDAHVYVVRLPSRGVYVIDEEFSFSFPSKLKQLPDLERLIDGLSMVETMLDDLSLIYETCQNNPTNAMERVMKESSRKDRKYIQLNVNVANVWFLFQVKDLLL
ncbi:uncharacterized protein EV154DRAFT_601379 [Mucor mucedo]|uniref:uncharacterized protein n=1 Tax=Mucor mucedo TaxID=29922 RepID=UPI002220FCC1|nr:uncharacterized protein EV154DRAFT_601379 [Mucor mucedo]KAI7892716.1 hypothetical protein EV154DRAFT_601379 [Mucor mucedo]